MFSEQMRARKSKTTENDAKISEQMFRNVTRKQKQSILLRWNGKQSLSSSCFVCETETGTETDKNTNPHTSQLLCKELAATFLKVTMDQFKFEFAWLNLLCCWVLFEPIFEGLLYLQSCTSLIHFYYPVNRKKRKSQLARRLRIYVAVARAIIHEFYAFTSEIMLFALERKFRIFSLTCFIRYKDYSY